MHQLRGNRFIWLPVIIIILLSGWNIVDVVKWNRRDAVLVVTSRKTVGTKISQARQKNSSYRDIESFLDELANQGVPMELQDHLSDYEPPPLQQCPQLTNGTLGQLIQHYHTEREVNKSDISVRNSAVLAALTMRSAPGIRDVDLLPPPHMLHQSLMRYANATRLNKHVLLPVYTPFGHGCSGEKTVDAGQCGERDLAASSAEGPFCLSFPSQEHHILVTDCGLVENCYAPNASHCYNYGAGGYGTTYAAPGIMSKQIIGVANDKPNLRTKYQLNPDMEVQELEELASPGAFVWPAEPGHFTNEILPALVLLDRLLPAHIPLLWPATVHVGRHGDALKMPLVLPTLYLQALREENGLKPGRPIIELNYTKPILYRAKRLYVFWSDSSFRLPISWLGQRLAAYHFKALARSRFERLYGQAAAHNVMARAMYRVVVLKRAVNTRRSIQNHEAVVTSIKTALGPEFEVDEYQPDGVWPAVERLNKACFVIGPHGANFNNILFLNNNCKPAWVLEVGYMELDQHSTRTTPAYLCMARNLGYKYFISFATQGGYDSPLVANTEEIFDIASAYKHHVAAVQRGQPNSDDEG